MASTNVKWYAMGFKTDGTPGARTICDYDPEDTKNASKISDLKDSIKKMDADISTVEIITAEEYDKYVQDGNVRDMDTGKPIPYVAPEPTEAEKLKSYQNTTIPKIQALLTATDYQAIKFSEGVITEAQFANLKEARIAWRKAINDIQAAATLADAQAVTYSTDIPKVD